MNYFEELASVDTGNHIEKKGKFTYLSWPWAIKELCKRHPDAKWKTKRFPLPNTPDIKVPYMTTPQGYFVEVVVTVNGVKRSQIHPVLNNQNKPIENPSPFDINTSIQRALVKAVALHGLGLNLYAGEDLPMIEQAFTQDQLDAFTELVKGDDPMAFTAFCQNNTDQVSALIDEHLKPHRENKTVTAEKERIRNLDLAGHNVANEIAEKIESLATEQTNDELNEALEEITSGEKLLVWARLEPQTKEYIKTIKQAA